VKQEIKKNINQIRTRIPEKLMLIVNFIVAIALILSDLACVISPVDFWFPAFLGLAHIPLLLINILFIFFWIFLLRKWVIGSLLVVVFSWGHIGTHFRFWKTDNKINSSDTLRIMSFNVRLFDLYQWKSEKKYKTRSRIFKMVGEQSPDLLCIQEYYSNKEKGFDVKDTLRKVASLKYNYVANFKTLSGEKAWGMAIFCKYPLFNKQRITFKNSLNNYFQYADFSKGTDTIRIFNIHFESIHFGQEDYLFMNDLTNPHPERHDVFGLIKKIYAKLGVAFSRRAQQVELVKIYVASSPYPVILCGDFNDTPASFVYNRIIEELDDSFCESGSGLSSTYPNLFIPLRIDYIMHSKESFQSAHYDVIREDLSDHFPITTTLVRKR
jgi:endonuclease/exonuclease/phosphatase family metal-dependent hydrolase